MIEVYKILHGVYDEQVTNELFNVTDQTWTRGHSWKLAKDRSRLEMEVSRGPVPDLETQGLGVRHCRIPRHFPMSGSGSGSTFLCPVFHVCNW